MRDTAQQPALLDVSGVAGDLDVVVAAGGAAVVELARTALSRVRDAPVDERLEHPGGWHAARLRGGPGQEEITCWRDGAAMTVQGTWAAGTLTSLHVVVDDRFWGMRVTPEGESFFSTDESVEGPVERELEARNAGRLREELLGWERSQPDRDRSADAWSPVPSIPAESGDDATGVKHSHDLEMPEGYGDLLEGLVEELAFRALEAHVLHGDIVLEGFDPERREEVVFAVMDARELSGDTPAYMAYVEELLESPQAILCTGISAKDASAIQRSLEDAGASSVFRRRDG